MGKEQIEELLKKFATGNEIDGEGMLKEILVNTVDSSIPTEVANIEAIDSEVLDSLQVGDKIAKITGKQKHLYVVTYKGEGIGEGICLTYVDAGLIETVSYDYTADGWVYNSTDKHEPGPEPEVGCRIEYLGITEETYSRENAIQTDIIVQKHDRLELIFHYETDGPDIVDVHYMHSVQQIGDTSVDVTNAFNYRNDSILAYPYLNDIESSGVFYASTTPSLGEWSLYTTDSDGSCVLDGIEKEAYPYLKATGINNTPLQLFYYVSNARNQPFKALIKDLIIGEHHLVPWRIEDKGYLKDLTTGTIYGNGEGYILGPDYVEE